MVALVGAKIMSIRTEGLGRTSRSEELNPQRQFQQDGPCHVFKSVFQGLSDIVLRFLFLKSWR